MAIVDLRPRHGLSLCAGGGGLDMGVMLAEPGFHTRCFVEWEAYPQQCLIAAQRAGYFAPAPIWDDVTTFDGKPWRGHIDLLTAGYPCQPFSLAGQRKGKDDERHLWPDVARIIGECAPELVLLENVEGHISLGLDTVLLDLAGLGYRHACGLFSTAETEGTQGRKRVFILARRKSIGERKPDDPERTIPREQCGWELGWDSSNGSDGEAPLDSRTSPRHDGTGQRTGPYQQGGERLVGAGSPGLSDSECSILSGQDRNDEGRATSQSGRAFLPHSPPGPEDFDAWRDVLSHDISLAPALGPSDLWHIADRVAAMAEAGFMGEAQAESYIRGVAHALASRSRALRLLGNGVDPMVAAYAFRSLGIALGLRPLDLERGSAAADGVV